MRYPGNVYHLTILVGVNLIHHDFPQHSKRNKFTVIDACGLLTKGHG